MVGRLALLLEFDPGVIRLFLFGCQRGLYFLCARFSERGHKSGSFCC
jgi:hypothetical protein